MVGKKGGLGRGFETLIPDDLFDDSFDPTATTDELVSELRSLTLDSVVADPGQPRTSFDEVKLQELTLSIQQHGVLQPIVVTKKGKSYEIIAGERRYRASIAAGLEKIPALVRTVTAQHKLELALIENLNRDDLNSLETATAYAKLRDQFNMSIQDIGKMVGGKSPSAISNTLRLLKLPKPVQQAIADGQMSEGQARPLIDFDEGEILKLLPVILEEGWSVRKIEQTIRSRKEPKKMHQVKKPDPYVSQRRSLEQKLDTPVKIAVTKKGVGTITIAFKDQKDLDRIQQALL